MRRSVGLHCKLQRERQCPVGVSPLPCAHAIVHCNVPTCSQGCALLRRRDGGSVAVAAGPAAVIPQCCLLCELICQAGQRVVKWT